MALRSFVTGLLVATSCPGASARLTTAPQVARVEPIVEPIAYASPKVGTAGPAVVRIVDARTGEPLPHAILHLGAERDQPTRGEFFSEHHVHADRDGFARITPSSHGLFFVEAQNYGTIALTYLEPSGVVPLLPGVDVPIALRDALDRPAPFASVGLCLYCGHTPDVAFATAGADGVAWLRSIDPGNGFADHDTYSMLHAAPTIRDLYPLGSGLSGDPDSVSWLPGDPAQVVRCQPCHDVVGRVVSKDGRPLAGAFVGSNGRHRGPWTRTDAAGEFRLVSGIGPGNLVVVYAGRMVFDARVPPRTRITLQVPFFDNDRAPASKAKLRLRTRHAITGAPMAGLVVRVTPLHQTADGYVMGQTDTHGEAEVEVEVGRCVVWTNAPRDVDRAPDGPPPGFESIEQETMVAEAGDSVCEFIVQPRPTVTVTLERVPDGARVFLATLDDSDQEITNLVAAGQAIAVPGGAPFAFRLAHAGAESMLTLPAVPRDARVTLRWPAATRVLGSLVDAAGATVPGRIALTRDPGAPEVDTEEWRDVETDGVFALDTARQGAAFLHVEPGRDDLRPRTLALVLPAFGAEEAVALGAVTLRSAGTPQLSVLGADGTPAALARVLVLRPGLTAFGVLGKQGDYHGLDLRAGDTVVVDLRRRDAEGQVEESDVPADTGCLFTRLHLQGEGPWALRQGTASIELVSVDDRGNEAGGAHVFSRDAHFIAARATFTLSGLDAGEHRVHVGLPGRPAVAITVSLGDGERRRVRVTLPTAPIPAGR